MPVMLRRIACLAAGAAAFAAVFAGFAGGPARSQSARIIKIIVPFAPGGSNDILGRLLADYVSQVYRQSAVVENRPGAGTVIATEMASRAAPDGNTVLMVGNSFIINPNLKR